LCLSTAHDFITTIVGFEVFGTHRLRRVLPLSLTFDHRIVTGEAARFLVALKSELELMS